MDIIVNILRNPNQFDAVLSETIVANKFTDLSDVSIAQETLNSTVTNFVVVYDNSISGFKLVDPDQVLISAASTISNVGYVGLPTSFLNTLDVNLDQKIDLDGGSF